MIQTVLQVKHVIFTKNEKLFIDEKNSGTKPTENEVEVQNKQGDRLSQKLKVGIYY